MAAVLIGEPNLEIRDLLVRVVEAMGWDAELALSSDARSVDLVVVEPGWPDALALARRLREERPELPIVCLSIYPRQLEFDLLAPAAYLVKPFSVAELQGVLRNALAARTVAVGAASAPLSHHTQ